MNPSQEIGKFLLSNYETKAYLALVANHPANGSQLSKHSGIPSAKIYEVLRNLREKGLAAEVGQGLYTPIPPEELLRSMRHGFESYLKNLKSEIQDASKKTKYEYVWTITGYDKVMAKAKEMISSAKNEIYVELYPEEAHLLDMVLLDADSRGVTIKYISMGDPVSKFDLQVIHPEIEKFNALHQGRIFDLVKDKEELLIGMFENGKEDLSPVNWAINHWFVKKEKLSKKELAIYEIIKNDAWASTRFVEQTG
jgi:sugar-specific transcriptional regulator TrmB